tara:strand:+ start:221 stop:2146 length:1926 start_codon:yes stop_codon:yes gene_type:complete
MNVRYILLGIIIFIVSLVVFRQILNPFHYRIIETYRNDDIDDIVNNYKAVEFEKPVSGDSSITNSKKINEDKTKLLSVDIGGNMKDPTKVEKDKCEELNETGECDGLVEGSCGYCMPRDKIMYGGCDIGFTWVSSEKKCIRNGAKLPYKEEDKRDSRPIGDLCNPTDKYPNPTNWIAPNDPRVVNICKKKKEQKVCKTITTCGDDSVTNICGWCPVTNKGMVKKDKGIDGYHKIKYDDDECNWDYESYGLNGPLISGSTCDKFGSKFPCVGTQKKDGTHTQECLDSLYKKEVTKKENFQNSNDRKIMEGMYVVPGCDKTTPSDYLKDSRSYKTILKDMNSNIKLKAKRSDNYKKALNAHKKCYNESDPDPCDNRFGQFQDLPLECTEKIFEDSGCKQNSLLNPSNNTFSDIRLDWKDKISKLQKQFPILSKILSSDSTKIKLSVNEKNQYSSMLNYFKQNDTDSDLNNQIFKSQFCNLNEINVTNKPCWYDFSLMMTSIPGIDVDYTSIQFENASMKFKSILQKSKNTSSNKVYSKNYAVFNDKYILFQSTYEKQYFPFWDFIKEYKNYWKKNWKTFVDLLKKHPNVSYTNNEELVFEKGSDFDSLVLKINNNKELKISKSVYLNDTDFPYASFIRIFNRY